MKKLLCVDDEQWVLDFLRMSLKTLAEEWEMEFVLSAEEALKLLPNATYDVVLSDIHLPGMSGIQLFHQVKAKFPHTIRIAFSGAADHNTVTQALKIAHQVLPKPVTPVMLRSAIDRARALRDQVSNPAVERVVAGIKQMPTVPALYEELLEVLQSQDSSAEKVAQVIAKDPGMTANLLRVANSIPFTMRSRVESPTQAVALLGIESVKSMVLGFKVCHDSKRAGGNQPEIEEVWRHGFKVATHAQTIASVENVGSLMIENSFLAGLLHDVGRLVLLTNHPAEYQKVLALVNMERLSVSQAEREIFGATHAQIGAYLLGKWGLRDVIVEAVAFHHEPILCPQSGFSILAAIHMANVCERENANIYGDDVVYDEAFMAQTGLQGKVSLWRQSLAA